MSTMRRSKVAALMAKQAWEPPTKDELKRFGGKAAVYSVGIGIGTALGHAANQLLLPKIMKNLSPKQRSLLAGGLGVAAGLAAAKASEPVFKGNRRDKGR